MIDASLDAIEKNALPWAIAATLVRPSEKVLSISEDGGFLFSAMEFETAVRLQSNLVHMICIDGTYDMVAAQEELKYGRPSGTSLGRQNLIVNTIRDLTC
jgi:acetolactate synthase-1/2/3 large subunit